MEIIQRTHVEIWVHTYCGFTATASHDTIMVYKLKQTQIIVLK